MFARECLQDSMGKDVLYDTMNREDLNWRKFHEQVAHKTVQSLKYLAKKPMLLMILWSNVLARRCRVYRAISIIPADAYDGATSADLGLKLRWRLYTLDSELFISQTKAIELHEPFEMVAVLPPNATGPPNNVPSLRW